MRKIFSIYLLLIFSAVVVAAQANSAVLRSGPMLGYSEMTETVVWLQTRVPARAQIRFWKHSAPKNVKSSQVVQTNAAGDHIARFVLSGLDFGAKYDYAVYLNDKKVELGFQPAFQTQAHWRWRTDPPAFKFAIGSCAYINDPPFDRPGKPYGGDFEIFETIAGQKPDFMIWLGDNVYYREPDWLSETAMRYRFAQNRELPELRRLLANAHQYAIWDDHDYGPNDSDRTYRGKEWALRIFKDYWANATYGHDNVPGVFGRFEWADVEFFLLDDRYHRSPNRMAASDPNKQMFGEAQMRWLTESLLSSRAPFKIVVSGGQILNRVNNFEAFQEFSFEQKRFFDFLRAQKIEGVVFLSGDRHHTELLKRTDITTYPLYEFTSSPLTSGGGYLKQEENNPDRVPDTWVTNGTRNFGVVEVSGAPRARKLTLRTLDKTGKQLWQYEIAETDLKFK
jgi:alkaline phosphatase D